LAVRFFAKIAGVDCCGACSAPVPFAARFCPSCGANLSKPETIGCPVVPPEIHGCPAVAARDVVFVTGTMLAERYRIVAPPSGEYRVLRFLGH
jgi:hypothetical protein